MQPYMQLAKMVVKQQDPKQALEVISELPLENRYVWRITSALKWAFCDFDDINVEADRATLEESALKKVRELLRLRPVQFCLFLKALLGQEEMERIMLEALAMAKAIEAVLETSKVLHRYADYRAVSLRKAIAKYVGVKPENILVGAGSSETMSFIIRAFSKPGEEVMLPEGHG